MTKFSESCEIKIIIKTVILMLMGTVLTACTVGNGMICGPQTPAAYCDRDAYQKLANPKSYGQYWTKPTMTTESWRQDWVECGGQANGQYFSDESTVPTVAAALTADKNKRAKLDT